MASLIFALFLLLFKMAASSAVTQSSHMTEPMCYDWGEWIQGALSVVEGGAGWLSCPLFSHPSVYNYTSTQSAGHNLVWYRLPDGEDLEQPITYSSRLSKDRERLWLQPAAAEDAGLYICMLRNKSSCSKISMRLKVVRRDKPLHGATCPPAVVTPIIHTVVPFEDGKTLDCPDLQDIIKMADKEPNVTWYHTTLTGKCDTSLFWDKNREQKGTSLQIYIMLERHQGLYSCSATYLRRGRAVSFSRSINVTAVYPLSLPKLPSILQVITVRQGSEVHLLCRALFPYLNSSRDIWWTVDGKTLDKVSKPQRFNNTIRLVMEDHGDRTEVSKLVIKDFGSDDLNREYNCSVRNSRGFETLRAQLEEEVWLPSLELGCGLGVTLVLMLLLFVVYHVFWLELLLFYRSWFGSDERHTDDKEYDVYISYARNSEDEQFVLSTLRGVLENELGYSVCIFDRDSLPGGTITDETLSFVARSRRLLVVVSPGYATQGSQALLELKAGIDGMALGGHLRVILVQYKPLQGRGWVRELRRARLALALVRWQGDKSRELTSGFWKRLRVELPVRRSSSGGEKEGALMRLYSQNSTNSQTGLISNTVKDPEKVLRCAA